MKYINIKENDYQKIIICLLAIVVIFILISNSYFSAKYKSSVNSSNSVRIAKWSVGSDIEDNLNNNLSIISEYNTPAYVIEVNSRSEVSSVYSIILSDVPDGLQVKLDTKEYKSADNNMIVFDNAGSFDVNDETTSRTHTLTFNDPVGTNNTGDKVIKIDVLFEQSD